MYRFLSIALLAAALQAQLSSPPRIGFVRDRAGAVRPVTGVAGSFLLGDPIQTGAISASFSGRFGFVKTTSELIVFIDGEITHRLPAPDGSASFQWSAEHQLKQVRFAQNGECARWTGQDLQPVACEVEESSPLPADAPQPVEPVERMDAEWRIVRAEAGLYAVRGDAVYLLPETSK